ncbi:hypothetical protein IHE44_0009694, partial [Lamprotornis superbus]
KFFLDPIMKKCLEKEKSDTAAAAHKAVKSALKASYQITMPTVGPNRQSNSNSDTCAEFRVKYVGAIEKLKYNESKSLEGPLDLINYIDVAQAFVCFPPKQDGKLPFVPGEEEFIMGVSKYGIKVSTSDQYDVLHRHALYLIVRMVCYDDGLGAGKSLLALKTTDAASEECSLWVYQCNSLQQHLGGESYTSTWLYPHAREASTNGLSTSATNEKIQWNKTYAKHENQEEREHLVKAEADSSPNALRPVPDFPLI